MVVGRGVDDSETFNCIKEMFGRINRDNLLQVLRNSEKKYEVTVPPANLKGYEQILQIIGKSSSKSVREDAAAFLCMLYINYQGEGSTGTNSLFFQLCDSLIAKVNEDFAAKRYS